MKGDVTRPMDLTNALLRVLCVAGAAVLVSTPLWAQPSDSNVFFDAPGLLIKKPRPGPPDVKAPATVWPRLDPGAAFCRSADDLRKLAARRAGEPTTGSIDCQLIRVATGIAILQREGPGMVQVQTTDPRAGGIGWTDAWLPTKEPPNRAQASSAR